MNLADPDPIGLRRELESALRMTLHLRSQLEVARYETESLLLDRLRTDAARKPLAAPASAGPPAVQATNVQLGASVIREPHSHLSARCEGLRHAGRPLPPVDIRLLLHHRRPGLVIFDQEGLREYFSSWADAGEEQGRSFMAVIPADAGGELLLDRFPASEYRLVLAIAEGLEERLSHCGSTANGHWRTVARQLLDQITLRQPRLRYDALRLELGSDRQVMCARFVFETVDLLGQPYDRIVVRASREADSIPWRLALEHPNGARTVLTGWPLGDDGRAVTDHALPCSTPGRLVAHLRAWMRLPQRDRDVCWAIVEAIRNRELVDAALAAVNRRSCDALFDATASTAQRIARCRALTPAAAWLRRRTR